MKLHQNQNIFRVLLEQIHARTGYRMDVLEKDYYVVLILKELAGKQEKGLPAYFKGGTALYKTLRATHRFSEDIDLSVDTRGCSRSQNEKRLALAAKRFNCLQRDVFAGKTNRSEVVSVYTYKPVINYDYTDALQRFGIVKIEATSFTISEPLEQIEISPLLFELSSVKDQLVLQKQFDVFPFKIYTVTIERIFIDKLFAAEAYTRRMNENNYAFEVSKHIYDLIVMENHIRIIKLFSDEALMHKLLDIRMQEEMNRLDGIPGYLSETIYIF